MTTQSNHLKLKLLLHIFAFSILPLAITSETTEEFSSIPEARIVVKISDRLVDSVADHLSQLLTVNIQKWQHPLNFDDNFFTHTVDGKVNISYFSKPIVRVDTSGASDEFKIISTFDKLLLSWTYDSYVGSMGMGMYWGKAQCVYQVDNFAMTFTVPGVQWNPVVMQNGKGIKVKTEYVLDLAGPITWSENDWKLYKWSFGYEHGQGEDYGGKLLLVEYQNEVLGSLAKALANCPSNKKSVAMLEATELVESSIQSLPTLSSSEPLLEVNNSALSVFDITQLYEHVSVRVYSNQKQSLWFVIEFFSKNTIDERKIRDATRSEEEDVDFEDQPNEDLTVDLQKVPYHINVGEKSEQNQALDLLKSMNNLGEGNLYDWKRKCIPIEDDLQRQLQFCNHRIIFHNDSQVNNGFTGTVENVTWEFSIIEIADDFFYDVEKQSVNFTVEATPLSTMHTCSNGTSFFQTFVSYCKITQIYHTSHHKSTPLYHLNTRPYIEERLTSLGEIIKTANVSSTIEWKVKLPSQYEYSILKSAWRFSETMLNVELQTNFSK